MKRSSISTVLIIVLAIMLGYNLKHALEKKQYEQDVRVQLSKELERFSGAYLDEVKFRNGKEPTIVAVVRTTADLTPAQVATLDDHLPIIRGKRSTLHVHVIKITELTRKGVYQYPEYAS